MGERDLSEFLGISQNYRTTNVSSISHLAVCNYELFKGGVNLVVHAQFSCATIYSWHFLVCSFLVLHPNRVIEIIWLNCQLVYNLIVWPLVSLAWSDFVVVMCSQISAITLMSTVLSKPNDTTGNTTIIRTICDNLKTRLNIVITLLVLKWDQLRSGLCHPFTGIFPCTNSSPTVPDLELANRKKGEQRQHQSEQNLWHFLTSNHYCVSCICKISLDHFHHFHDAMEMHAKPLPQTFHTRLLWCLFCMNESYD